MRAMETSFTEANIVNQHTLSPSKIWKEISRPNGTGILFLSEQLKNSAHPIVTRTRLAIDLDRIQNELLEILEPYLISESLDADLKKAQINAAISYSTLIALANKKNSPLPSILSSLVISDTDIWNLLYDHVFGMEKKEQIEEKELNIDIVESFNDLGVDLAPGMSKKEIVNQLRDIYIGLEDEEIEEVIKNTLSVSLNEVLGMISSTNGSNSQEIIADLIIAFWTESLMNNALNHEVFLKISDREVEQFRNLLAEIIKGRARFNLNKIVTDTIKDIKTGTIVAEDIDLVASCCTTILNKFLFSAGWEFAKEEDKPELGNNQGPIFSEYGKEYDKEDELIYSSNTNKDFFRKWSLGCRTLYTENVLFQYQLGNKNYNSVANQKLSKIIQELQPNK